MTKPVPTPVEPRAASLDSLSGVDVNSWVAHTGRELAALPQSLYFAVERVDGAVEPRGRARRGVEHHGHGGAKDAGVGPVVAQGRSQTVVGVAVAAG